DSPEIATTPDLSRTAVSRARKKTILFTLPKENVVPYARIPSAVCFLTRHDLFGSSIRGKTTDCPWILASTFSRRSAAPSPGSPQTALTLRLASHAASSPPFNCYPWPPALRLSRLAIRPPAKRPHFIGRSFLLWTAKFPGSLTVSIISQ
ncbi:hypothetical protein GWI33_006738, partial [Rhynchophorus ferrugineus]